MLSSLVLLSAPVSKTCTRIGSQSVVLAEFDFSDHCWLRVAGLGLTRGDLSMPAIYLLDAALLSRKRCNEWKRKSRLIEFDCHEEE